MAAFSATLIDFLDLLMAVLLFADGITQLAFQVEAQPLSLTSGLGEGARLPKEYVYFKQPAVRQATRKS
jgi:hypothetical protein